MYVQKSVDSSISVIFKSFFFSFLFSFFLFLTNELVNTCTGELLRDITSLIDTWRYIAAYKSDTWKDIATTAAARAVATKSAVLGRQIIDFYSNSQRERQ